MSQIQRLILLFPHWLANLWNAPFAYTPIRPIRLKLLIDVHSFSTRLKQAVMFSQTLVRMVPSTLFQYIETLVDSGFRSQDESRKKCSSRQVDPSNVSHLGGLKLRNNQEHSHRLSPSARCGVRFFCFLGTKAALTLAPDGTGLTLESGTNFANWPRNSACACVAWASSAPPEILAAMASFLLLPPKGSPLHQTSFKRPQPGPWGFTSMKSRQGPKTGHPDCWNMLKSCPSSLASWRILGSRMWGLMP